MSAEIEITVNGEAHALPSPMNVAALLEHLGVRESRVAVELDREIVPKAAYGETQVGPGAKVEIVSFVGGG